MDNGVIIAVMWIIRGINGNGKNTIQKKRKKQKILVRNDFSGSC